MLTVLIIFWCLPHCIFLPCKAGAITRSGKHSAISASVTGAITTSRKFRKQPSRLPPRDRPRLGCRTRRAPAQRRYARCVPRLRPLPLRRRFRHDRGPDASGIKKLRLEGTDEQIPLFDEVLALFEMQRLSSSSSRAQTATIMRLRTLSERLDSYKGRVLHRVVRSLLPAGPQEAAPGHLPRAAVDEFLQGPVRPAVL